MQPSVGRIVHYVSYGTPGGEYSRECRAAIITEVALPYEPGSAEEARANEVGLFVANPAGLFLNRGVSLDEGKPDTMGGTNLCEGLDFAGGTWHLPARVQEWTASRATLARSRAPGLAAVPSTV